MSLYRSHYEARLRDSFGVKWLCGGPGSGGHILRWRCRISAGSRSAVCECAPGPAAVAAAAQERLGHSTARRGCQHAAAAEPRLGRRRGRPTLVHCSMTATHYRESVHCCMPSDNCSPLVQSISPCAVNSLEVFPCKVCQNQNAML